MANVVLAGYILYNTNYDALSMKWYMWFVLIEIWGKIVILVFMVIIMICAYCTLKQAGLIDDGREGSMQ